MPARKCAIRQCPSELAGRSSQFLTGLFDPSCHALSLDVPRSSKSFVTLGVLLMFQLMIFNLTTVEQVSRLHRKEQAHC